METYCVQKVDNNDCSGNDDHYGLDNYIDDDNEIIKHSNKKIRITFTIIIKSASRKI